MQNSCRCSPIVGRPKYRPCYWSSSPTDSADSSEWIWIKLRCDTKSAHLSLVSCVPLSSCRPIKPCVQRLASFLRGVCLLIDLVVEQIERVLGARRVDLPI